MKKEGYHLCLSKVNTLIAVVFLFGISTGSAVIAGNIEVYKSAQSAIAQKKQQRKKQKEFFLIETADESQAAEHPKNLLPIKPAASEQTTVMQEPVVPTAIDKPIEKWALMLNDKTLYQALRRWTEAAGFQLIWETEKDFAIEAQVVFNGDFEVSIMGVMAALQETDYPLQAVINQKMRYLRVIRYIGAVKND